MNQPDTARETNLVQHLPQIGCCRGMNERAVTLTPHRLDHAERSERIDKTGGAVSRSRARRQHETIGSAQTTILRIHCTTDDRYGLSQQMLRVAPGLDHLARAFIADGQ